MNDIVLCIKLLLLIFKHAVSFAVWDPWRKLLQSENMNMKIETFYATLFLSLAYLAICITQFWLKVADKNRKWPLIPAQKLISWYYNATWNLFQRLWNHSSFETKMENKKTLWKKLQTYHMLKLILTIPPPSPPTTSSCSPTHFWQPKIIWRSFTASKRCSFCTPTMPVTENEWCWIC